MRLSEWIKEDDIAIGHIAVYYGIPKYGHENCYKQMHPSQHAPEHVPAHKTGMEGMRCIACGKLLVQA